MLFLPRSTKMIRFPASFHRGLYLMTDPCGHDDFFLWQKRQNLGDSTFPGWAQKYILILGPILQFVTKSGNRIRMKNPGKGLQ